MPSSTLRMTRQAGAIGFEFLRRPFEIILDGSVVGSVASHAATEIPVQPGHHKLRLRGGRFLSPLRSFDAADGETVRFQCHSVQIWPTLVLSLIKPDLGISLRPQ
jgi:hypothetical protein